MAGRTLRPLTPTKAQPAPLYAPHPPVIGDAPPQTDPTLQDGYAKPSVEPYTFEGQAPTQAGNPNAPTPQPQAPQVAPAPVEQYQPQSYQPTGFQPPAPVATAPEAASSPSSADPFAAMGGGVLVNGGWVPNNHPLAASAGASSGSSSSSASFGSLGSEEREALLNLIKTPTKIDPAAVQSDPAMQAYRLAQHRQEGRDRASIAERAAHEGWSDSGAQDSEFNKLREGRGVAEATFAGELSNRMLQDNRATVVQALQIAIQNGQFNQAQALQRELSSLDAAIRQSGINASSQQASDRLGYDYASLQTQANRDALMMLLAGMGGGG